MIFDNYYDIDIQYNGQSLELDCQSVSFAIHDSIFSQLSSASFTITDSTGLYRNNGLATEGNHIQIQYGLNPLPDEKLVTDFVVESSENINVSTPGILSGVIRLNLIHNIYDKQVVDTVAYNQKISKVVEDYCQAKNFKKTNIEQTEDKSIWYQLGVDFSTFIDTVLVVNAYSNNSDETPFFCFINSKNEFNFKSYKNLINQTEVETLTWVPVKPDAMQLNSILDIKPYNTGSKKQKYTRQKTIITRSYIDGSFVRKVSETGNHPSNKASSSKIPIVSQEKATTDYVYYNYTFRKLEDNNSLRARINYDFKDSLFIEKYLITTAFNPRLVSGRIVNLQLSVASPNGEGIESSAYQSGNYLIEDTIHSWDGTTKKAITTLIVSRKFCKSINKTLVDKLVW